MKKTKTRLSTRERILLAAEKALVDSHVQGLRFSQIAKLARVPQPLLGYHFPTLEALLLELVQRQLEKLRTLSVENIEKHSSQPLKALEAYIRTPFELAERDITFRAVWSGFYHLATVHASFADLNRSVRSVGRERTLALVAMTLEKHPHSAPLAQLTDLATCIQGIITGYGFMAATETAGEYKRLADLAIQTTHGLMGIRIK